MRFERFSNWTRGRQWGRLKGIVQNFVWLAVDRLMSLVTGLLVGAWVARYLGPAQLGVWAYAGAFVSLFAAVAGLGLNSIVVRELAQDDARRYEILGSAAVLRFGGSFLALLVSVWAIGMFRPDAPMLRVLVAILAGATVVQSLDVITLWFQAQVESKYVVWSKRVASLAVAAVQVILILTNAPLVAFAWTAFLEICIASTGFILFYTFTVDSLRRWRINWALCGELLRDSWPLIVAGLAVSLYMRIDKIMLGEMTGNEAVGTYEVAVRVSELWYFIPVSVASTVFPLIVRTRKNENNAVYKARFQLFSDVMVGVSYLIAIPMVLIAQPLVRILFGSSYGGAAPILVIHIWALTFVSLGLSQSQWLVAENLVRYSMWATVLGAVTNVMLNLWLIPRYAGVGAAWATVISYAVAGYVVSLFVSRMRDLFAVSTKSIFLPFRLPSVWRSLHGIISSTSTKSSSHLQA